ncbi:glycosyltransferase family 2 protein [Anaerobacillus sp. HL2]|nr:glycosyltransferase family 2 protein [Anaerobacillus sp. HL2]
MKNINFEIRYIKQKNGGKHRALNNGIRNARYDYIYIIDSDDYMTEDAVEKIYEWMNLLKEYGEFAGVSGLRGTKSKKIMSQFPNGENYIDATNLERKKLKLLSDKG